MNVYQKQYIDAEKIPLALKEAFGCFNRSFDTEYSESNGPETLFPQLGQYINPVFII